MIIDLRDCKEDRRSHESQGAQHEEAHLRKGSISQVRNQAFFEFRSDRGLRLIGELVCGIPFLAFLAMTELI